MPKNQKIRERNALYRRRWYHKLSPEKRKRHTRRETLKHKARKNIKAFIHLTVPFVYSNKLKKEQIWVSKPINTPLSRIISHGYTYYEPIMVYFVKLEGFGEVLYKIGITKYSVKARFRGCIYKITTITSAILPAYIALAFEKMFLYRYKEYYKYPKHYFPGATECFFKDLSAEFNKILPKNLSNVVN